MRHLTAVLLSGTALAYDNTALQQAVNTAQGDTPATDGNTWVIQRDADSEQMVPYWDQTDDLIKGANAVKDAGERYLLKFPMEQQQDYDFRRRNAKYTNVYGDIVETLSSKPFEKEVSLVTGEGTEKKEPPEEIQQFIEDVDGSGNNLTGFAAATFYNGINSAVDWIFVDYPNTGGEVRTRAQAKAAGVRPHWSHVLGRNVLAARSAIIGGREVWTYIKIFEPGEPSKVRIMERTDGGTTWELWREFRNTRNSRLEWVLEASGTISIGEIPMVPFITGRRDGKRYYFFPMMQSAADLQVELYQEESGSKNIRTLAGYPMLAGQGVKPQKGPDDQPVTIGVGPGRSIYTGVNGDGSSGRWEFIQPDAGLMNHLKDNVKETIANLRELGRVPLTAQSSNVTVVTSAAAAGKTRSAVGACALNLKNALENALVLTCKWLGIPDTTYSPEVYVYTDFDAFLENTADLDALNKARAAGDISQRTYWAELKRRGVLSDDFDAQKELELLLEEVPGDETVDENGNVIDPDNPGAGQGTLDL